jgi:hypothetical protein
MLVLDFPTSSRATEPGIRMSSRGSGRVEVGGGAFLKGFTLPEDVLEASRHLRAAQQGLGRPPECQWGARGESLGLGEGLVRAESRGDEEPDGDAVAGHLDPGHGIGREGEAPPRSVPPMRPLRF